MSGRTKQANRTKNNVRPSSSGRSAELLSSTVNPALLQVGPGNMLPIIFPGLAGVMLEQPISNEFQLCFKKFYKKDPITKIKALNELKDLVAKSEKDEVVNALASWTHYYPSLTVDMDRKVREATQTCHGDIIRKCGRQVALHIKRLLPAWLMAQHDEYVPVQQIAENDLKTTFPGVKLIEAIQFCKVDICNLYMDNLKGNAEFMLSSKKTDDEEERQAQIARVMSCTLRAMQLLINKLPENQDDWLWNSLLPLLCANSYWKLAAHPAPGVRVSFYIVTEAMVSRFHDRLPAELARRCARTLVAHGEKSPEVCAQRWRALMTLMFDVKDYLDLIDNPDLLLKRLWDVFENAAWGDAQYLAMFMSSMLELVPARIVSESFYNKMFTALFTGLCSKRLLNEESQCKHWNNIISSAVRHVSQQQGQYAVRLVSWAQRTWLERVLAAPDCPGKRTLIVSTANSLTDVLACWIKLRKAGESPDIEIIIKNFWLNVGSAISAEVEKLPPDSEEFLKLSEAHIQFMLVLRNNIDNRMDPDAPARERDPDEPDDDRYLADLDDTTETLIALHMEIAHKHQLVTKILPLVMPLLRACHSRRLFRYLAQRFEANSPLEFYVAVLKKWLTDDKLRCEAVAEVAFQLVEHLEDDHQDAVFNSFEELSPEVIRWCLSLALAPHNLELPATVRWLRSASAERALVALARLDEDDQAKELLLKALAHTDGGDVVISDATISGIVSTCTEMLNKLIAHDAEITLPEDAPRAGKGRRKDVQDPFVRLEPRVLFSAQIVHALPAQRTACALPLLLSLFRLTLRIPRNSPLLAEEAWTDALWAWRDAARRLPPASRATYVRDALLYLHWHLFQDLEQLNIERIEHVVSLCPYFVIASDDLPPPADSSELVAHSQLLLDMEVKHKPAQVPLEVFALQLDVIWGDLNCPFERDNDWIAAVAKQETVLTKETLMIHAYKILFRALYVKNILLRLTHTEEQVASEPTWCAAIIRVEYFRKQFFKILHDYAVIHVLYDHYAFWTHYDIIRDVKTRLDDLIFDVVTHVPEDVHDTLTAGLSERAAVHGYYWAYAKHHYHRIVADVNRATNKHDEASEEIPQYYDGSPEMVPVDELKDATEDDSQSHSSSSFEILDAFAKIHIQVVTDDTVSCNCHQLHSSPEEVFSPLLLDRLTSECGKKRRSSYLSKAAKPNAKLASTCRPAAMYVDIVGEMILRNGYYHDAQMKALQVKKQKLMVKKKFDNLQDAKLTGFEVNGQYTIFDKWTDDPDLYRQLNEDVNEFALYTAKDYAMVRSYYSLYASHAPHVDEFISDIASENAQCNLDAVINGYYRHNETMLFERSLKTASWLQLASTAATLDLLCEAVTTRGWEAPALHWDFTNIALCSALSSLELSTPMWSNDALRMALVARPALELYVRVRRFIGGVRRECTRRQPVPNVAALPNEWVDIFAPDAAANIYLLVCHVLENTSKTVTAAQVAILHSLTEASKLLEPTAMPAVLKSGRLTLQRVAGAATRALADACHHGFKYLAYYTLRALAPSLIEADEAHVAARATPPTNRYESAETEDDEKEAVIPDLTLTLYHEHLLQLQELVDATLSNYAICDDICELVPHSDSHSVVLGYLLLCVALHRHCELPTGDLFVHYGTLFHAQSYVEGILPAVLRLLPAGVVHYMAARLPALSKTYLPWFIRLQDFDLNEPCTAEDVSRLACGVMLRLLGGPGAAGARGWWAVQRAREATALARLVNVAVAPALLNHQLAETQTCARELGPRAKVSVCWSARSAACALRSDQQRAPTLRVSLSAAHPLHAPRVLCAPPGPDPHWITLYLGYRNGRVIDAMRMWLKAVSAGLPGAVHCYVCYCRAHPHDGSVPSVSCFQCQNSFHSQCLRRWFKTSNRSSCPICRTNF